VCLSVCVSVCQVCGSLVLWCVCMSVCTDLYTTICQSASMLSVCVSHDHGPSAHTDVRRYPRYVWSGLQVSIEVQVHCRTVPVQRRQCDTVELQLQVTVETQ